MPPGRETVTLRNCRQGSVMPEIGERWPGRSSDRDARAGGAGRVAPRSDHRHGERPPSRQRRRRGLEASPSRMAVAGKAVQVRATEGVLLVPAEPAPVRSLPDTLQQTETDT